VRTLAISRSNYRVLTSESKITRADVTNIIQKSTLLGWSNRWVESYCQELNLVAVE